MSLVVAMPLIMGASFALSLGFSLAGPVVAAPARWKDMRERRVRWIGGNASDDEAQAVRDAIVGRGLSSYGDVACHVADRIWRTDHERAGWISDIGFFHSWYLLHACQLLERVDGRLVHIDRS